MESINYTEGNSHCSVLFMHPDDCRSYYDATANGIPHPEEKGIVFVELADEPEPMSEIVRGWYDSGVTRCVRATGVEEDWGLLALRKLAAEKNRKVERVLPGVTQSGVSQ